MKVGWTRGGAGVKAEVTSSEHVDCVQPKVACSLFGHLRPRRPGPKPTLSSTLIMADDYPTLFRQSPQIRVGSVAYADA